MVCLSRPYHFKFFKGCLPQILLSPFLNTLTHIFLNKHAEASDLFKYDNHFTKTESMTNTDIETATLSQ